jgi:DNA (cytosine-5)-methyltransferase 1
MNILSLFANVGIGETRLNEVQPKSQVVLSNEICPKRVEVYRYMHPKHRMMQGDIRKLKSDIIAGSITGNVDVVIATPPCQSFSVINNKKIDNDPRDNLVVEAVEIAKILQPRLIIFENVGKQISLNIGNLSYTDYIQQTFPQYYSKIVSLDAADFGVPQRRKRMFTIISKKTIIIPQKKKHNTVHDAIGHLPSIEANQKGVIGYDDGMHYGPPNSDHHVLWAKHTPTGKSAFDNFGINEFYPQTKGRKIKGFNTTYRRNHWDTVAYTITANHGGPNGSNTLHPGNPITSSKETIYSDARTFSVREAMILMGLPFDTHFPLSISYRDSIKYLGEGLSPIVLRDLLNANPI